MGTHDAVTASAPGKLFLLGEYAVLHGAPAVLAALGTRARVRAVPADDGQWHIRAPDTGVTGLALGPCGTLPDALAPTTQRALAVFDAARATTAADMSLPPLHVGIETRGFSADGGKLGVGASAAVAAALTGALAHTAGARPARTTILERAVRAHQRAQNGEGSGADVATAVLGGIVAFAPDRIPRRLSWPTGLHALAVPTGDGADTQTLVGATRRLAKSDPETHRRCIEPLAEYARRGARALSDGDVDDVLAVADAYFEGLDTLGAAAGADIVTPAHRRLRRVAAEAGGVFKPTGAGGGDLGLVLAGSEQRAAACAAALTRAGHPPVDLRFGGGGLHVRSVKLR